MPVWTAIKKVRMTENIDEVNQLLQDGWILMDIISDGHSVNLFSALKIK